MTAIGRTAILMATTFLAGFSADAADLAVHRKAPVAVAPAFTWTGFYVGGQVGRQWGESYHRETVIATGVVQTFRPYDTSGIVGGAHAGLNWQLGRLVLGVEGDIEASSFKGGVRFPPSTDTVDVKSDWQGSIRGRLGAAFERLLLYATAGVAFANIQHIIFDGVSETNTTTAVGWTAGGGLEYAFAPNWSARVEYRRTDFDTLRVRTQVLYTHLIINHDPASHAVRFGISYRFGGTGG